MSYLVRPILVWKYPHHYMRPGPFFFFIEKQWVFWAKCLCETRTPPPRSRLPWALLYKKENWSAFASKGHHIQSPRTYPYHWAIESYVRIWYHNLTKFITIPHLNCDLKLSVKYWYYLAYKNVSFNLNLQLL